MTVGAFYYLGSSGSVMYVDVAALSIAYALSLLTVMSEIMQVRLARDLTRWRGPLWIKEIDYVYLLLASAGILVGINRIPTIQGKADVPEVYGLVILTTAIVVRALKVRAEVNEWNKAN